MYKAVARGQTINFNNRCMWIPVKYEMLPKLYFRCGRILYEEQGCNLGLGARNQGKGTDFQCGSWLRVDSEGHSKWIGVNLNEEDKSCNFDSEWKLQTWMASSSSILKEEDEV